MIPKFSLLLLVVLLQFGSQAQNKSNLDKLYQTSIERYEIKQYKQAQSILDFIFSSDSTYSKAYALKSDILLVQGKTKAALDAINKALKIKEQNTVFLSKRALVYYHLGQKEKAKSEIGKILDTEPKSIDALYAWAFIENRSEKHSSAIRILNKAKRIDSKNLKILYELGYAYFKTSECLKAIKQFDKILKLNSKYQAEGIYTMRGSCKDRMENPIGAILDFREALRINPRNCALYNNIALIYTQQGSLQKSMKYFNASIKLNNKQGLAFYNRGLAHYELKHYEQAYNDFEKACQLGCKKREDALGYYNRLKKKLKK